MSRLSKGLKKVTKVGTGLLGVVTGIGEKPGVPNPFQIPDYSKLNTPVNLLSGYKPIDETRNDSLFNDLLTSINGQKGAEQDQLNQTLAGIDEDTKQALAGVHQDALDRGLGGPGLASDIEFSGLGAAAGAGAKNKAAARTSLALDQGKRTSDAYSNRYASGLDTSKTNAATYNDLLKTGSALTSDQTQLLSKLITDLYTGGEKNNIDTQQPGYLDNILRNIKLNIGIGK